MPNTLIIELNDAEYNSFKCAADAEGTAVEAWFLNTVREAMSGKPFEEQLQETEVHNGWPAGFFEATYGSLADDPLERQPQAEPEIRELVR